MFMLCTHLPSSVGAWWVLSPKDHEVGMGLDHSLCLSDEKLAVVIQHLTHQREVRPTEHARMYVDESQLAGTYQPAVSTQ